MGPYPMTLEKMYGHNAYTGRIAGPRGAVGYCIIGSPVDLWFEAAYRYAKMLPRLAIGYGFNGWLG